jgi:hypothetical protein
MTTSTTISTATLARALILALDEHDVLETDLRAEIARATRAMAELSDPTRAEYEVMRTTLTQLLHRVQHIQHHYLRLEAICLGTSTEVCLDGPWTLLPMDLRMMLAGHLETVALESAADLLAQARHHKEDNGPLLSAGETGLALYLLTGMFPEPVQS